MFMAMIRSMLGPFNAVLDYFIAHPNTLTLLLSLWLVMYVGGRYQLKRIEARSTAFVLERCRSFLLENPGITPADIYQRIYPMWADEFKKWRFLYIPSKFDLWPVAASLNNVKEKMPFSAAWIAKVFLKNGIRLSETRSTETG